MMLKEVYKIFKVNEKSVNRTKKKMLSPCSKLKQTLWPAIQMWGVVDPFEEFLCYHEFYNS